MQGIMYRHRLIDYPSDFTTMIAALPCLGKVVFFYANEGVKIDGLVISIWQERDKNLTSNSKMFDI